MQAYDVKRKRIGNVVPPACGEWEKRGTIRNIGMGRILRKSRCSSILEAFTGASRK